MDLLDKPTIDFKGKEVLFIDDEVYDQVTDQNHFLLKSGLKPKSVIFCGCFDDALSVFQANKNIKLVITDLRIPKRNEDLEDYNPHSSSNAWGELLVKELIERFSGDREVNILVISAYNVLNAHTIPEGNNPAVMGFLEKPINFNRLDKILTSLTQYSNSSELNSSDSEFLTGQSQFIKDKIQSIGANIIEIGVALEKVRVRLRYSKSSLTFDQWLRKEFDWSPRQARRYMTASRKLGSYVGRLSKLQISQTAFWCLSERKTSPQVLEKVLELGESKKDLVITPLIVEKVRSKYIQAQDSEEKIDETSSDLEIQKKGIFIPSDPKNTNLEKGQIISIQKNINPIIGSCWQLGEKHILYFGSPKSKKLKKIIPKIIHLFVSLPSENDKSTPNLKALSSLIYYTSLDFDYKNFENILRETIEVSTNEGDAIVFFYLHEPNFLDIADDLGCRCFVVENNVEICNEIIDSWKEKNTVQRLVI